MFSKRQKLIKAYIFCIIALSTLPLVCTENLVLITKFTNCTLSFQTGLNISAKGMQLTSCTRKLCLRNLLNGNCINLQQFKFGKQKCYQQCCGRNDFDLLQCQQFNQISQSRRQIIDKNLIIMLTIVSIGLLIATIIFIIFYLQCFKNKQKNFVKPRENQFQWKQCNFDKKKECFICKESQAFIMSSCGTFYHLKCLSDNNKWSCSHCSKKIKKTKVFCPVCFKKCLVIQSQNFEQFDKKLSDMYQLHPYKCMDQIALQMEEQEKYSQLTKQ